MLSLDGNSDQTTTRQQQSTHETGMLLFNKYLNVIRRPPRPAAAAASARGEAEEGDKAEDSMFSPCIRDVTEACASGCFTAPVFGSMAESKNVKLNNRTTTTTRTSRSNFVKATTSSLFPNTHFTNHESLPALPDAFASFVSVYPQFAETQQADSIRGDEYYHLSEHVCLDYAGISLFSHAQMQASTAPSTSTAPPPANSALLQPPFFNISYKSASLVSQAQHQTQDTALERAITARIMRFLSVSDEEYSMVCTANRTTAFRLLAESYPFHTNKSLLSVYDYETEAVDIMAESAQKRGAKVMSASFTWPSMRIHSTKLTKKLIKSSNKRRRGLFVFPLLSRMTGSRYPYLWMSVAKEYGWHVVLDACALGPKDLDTFGLSLIKPDFIICSFFKVFGENPSGFAGLLIKKSSLKLLEASNVVRSIGIVSIVPTGSLSQLSEDYSTTELDAQQSTAPLEEDGPISAQTYNGSTTYTSNAYSESTSDHKQKQKEEPSSEIVELEMDNSARAEMTANSTAAGVNDRMKIECRGLEHADSLGLLLISSRLRCITNWLVLALMRLRHPHSGSGHSLVKIYGPRVKFDRGHALAFNVFDWKGEKVEPALVQKLADRSSISLSCGFLKSILFSDKYEAEKDKVLEKRVAEATVTGSRRKQGTDLGIHVVNASFSFLTNFEDAYRLWTFVARFLDADFVEKERWRYMALNQKMVEV